MGPYRLLRELGRGGMGAVYVAEHVGLRRRVALKVRLAGAADDEGARRFLIEGQAAARLRHPGIVAVHETGRDAAGQPWLAMDLVEGEGLDARVSRGPLPAAEVVRIGLLTARALAHAHAQGVLHRDLKPANVLLRASDGAPLLVDFGLAKVTGAGVESLTRTGEVLGTPSYMAPEQANGERVDARADVWSLGATLYHLAVGRSPFGGAGLVQTLAAVLRGAVVPPRELRPDLPADIEAVILRCLTPDRARRCPSAEALAAELERLARGEESQALGQARAAARWRVLAVVAVVVAGAALTGGVTAALVLAARRPPQPGGTDAAPPTSSAAAVATEAVDDVGGAKRLARGRSRPRRSRTAPLADATSGAWARRRSRTNPDPRWCTALAYDPRSEELYLFGGRAGDKSALGDLWSWNGEEWLQHLDRTGPEARFGHAMAWDTERGRLVLLGGTWDQHHRASSATVWELDGDGWTRHDPEFGPGPRVFHGAAYDPRGRRVLLFGGGGTNVEAVDDGLWSWNGEAWEVLRRPAGAGPDDWPTARRYIGVAWDPASEALYVAGDVTPKQAGARRTDAELWRWRPDGGWTLLKLPDGRGREHPSLAGSPGGLFLFAGGDATGGFRQDLWRLREGRWTSLDKPGAPEEMLPRPRRYAALAHDDGRGALVLYGGNASEGPRGDVWERTEE